MKIRPISCRDVTRLLSRHFLQRFVHRFRSSSRSHFAWLVQKKEITTNSLRWPQALHPKKQPTKMLKDLSKRKPTKTLKEDAQRRSIDEVDFAKWKQNKTTPRHSAARIRCLPQQISIACEKKVGDEYEPSTLRGIIVSVEYLKNLPYSESIIKGQRSTVELFERHLFKRISQLWYDTVVQFLWRLRLRAASCNFAEFNSYSG